MMGVDALLKEVEDRRNKALEALEAEYAAKREEVKKRTAEQVAYIMESAKKEAVALAQKEVTKIEGAAKLQSKKLLFDATEKLLENNIAALRDALAEFASSPSYVELLAKMAKYASKRLGREDSGHMPQARRSDAEGGGSEDSLDEPSTR